MLGKTAVRRERKGGEMLTRRAVEHFRVASDCPLWATVSHSRSHSSEGVDKVKAGRKVVAACLVVESWGKSTVGEFRHAMSVACRAQDAVIVRCHLPVVEVASKE